jgi:hypothetical protein
MLTCNNAVRQRALDAISEKASVSFQDGRDFFLKMAFGV